MMTPINESDSATPAPATDGAEGVSAPQRRWYIVRVQTRAEKAVREDIADLGFEAYVATRKEIHLWSRGQRRTIEKVLITNVVFVYVTDAERQLILRLPNVLAFMTDPSRKQDTAWKKPLAIIPDAEMHLLQSMLAQNDAEVEFATSGFAVGDYVRILGFDGDNTIAQIIRLPGDKNTYVGLRVSFLGCAYMQVPPSNLLKVHPPKK